LERIKKITNPIRIFSKSERELTITFILGKELSLMLKSRPHPFFLLKKTSDSAIIPHTRIVALKREKLIPNTFKKNIARVKNPKPKA